MKKGTYTIQINADLHKRIKLASAMENKSITLIVEEALNKFVAKWDITYVPVDMDKEQLDADLAAACRGEL